MKLISLTQNKFTQVDDEDFEWLNQWKWYANKSKNTFYALRNKGVIMHREILRRRLKKIYNINFYETILQVDHINRNGLDNRKSNLRIATHSQNACNKPKVCGKSKYKGVHLDKKSGIYYVLLKLNGKIIFQKWGFSNQEEAAIAYNKAAIKYHGEFACLNDIQDVSQKEK